MSWGGVVFMGSALHRLCSVLRSFGSELYSPGGFPRDTVQGASCLRKSSTCFAQNGVMSLVYPENMALRAVLPFISWDCRRFLQGQNVCTSDQLGAFSYCSKKYKNHIPLETCQVIEETANKVPAVPPLSTKA